VLDRRLRAVGASVALRQPRDLWSLLPDDLAVPFTTRDLAEQLGRPLAFAQRVAYCLRLTGAAEAAGKLGNRRIYHVRQDAGDRSADDAEGVISGSGRATG
jgi:hypothetical protein